MKRSRFGGYAGMFAWLTLALALLAARQAAAQQIVASGARSADGLWQAATDQNLSGGQRRADLTGPYAVVQLNRTALDALLALAPHENDATRLARPVVVTLPLPTGGFSRFRIEESPILAPELAAAFPAIRTYRGSSLDDPTATARLDITQAGFHAIVLAAGTTVYIDPYAPGDLVNHVSYDKASLRRPDVPFRDFVEGDTGSPRLYNELPLLNGTILRTYRLALAASAEYVNAAGGTPAAALARMTTSMNRVNGIYERELAVRLTLMTGTSASPLGLISTNPADYTNDNGSNMMGQNQARIDSIIGTANYDIGHVFSTGGGGIAYISAVCNTALKARGVTGSSNPVTDAFDVDYVAHEMGHQFGANHTFNGTTGSCGVNRSAEHAYEVGGGSTMMAYAGLCSAESTQLHSHDLFNFESLNEITSFTTSGGGSSCGMTAATGNTLPMVTVAEPSYTVPKQTPFTLTALASDANDDALTYVWEEHDLGLASFDAGSAATDAGNRPLFRSYAPTSSPSRTFPSLPYILNNANVPPQTYACATTRACLTGEVLPSLDRTMSFEVTVRDNRAAGGGVASAATEVTVNAMVGPFAVASPNTAVTWPGGSTQTVTWSVNGADMLAADVRISLSTNGGATFPITLSASTPNDGSETIVVPNLPTTSGRVRVEAVGNVFFDVSDVSFTIVAGTAAEGDLAVDFGPSYGLWLRYNPTGSTPLWMPIHGLSPSVMAAGDIDGNGKSDLVVDFPGYGVWIWMNNTDWVALHFLDANQIVIADLDGNGQDDIVVSFPDSGLWVRHNNTSWTQLHNLAAAALAAGNVDGDAGGQSDLIVSFTGHGVWTYMNNAIWVQRHPADATTLQTGDMDGNGQDEIVLSFPGLGVWAYVNASGWSQLHNQDPAGISVGNIDGDAGGRKDVIVNFPGFGVWALMNNSTWTQLHGLNASTIAIRDLDASGKDDVILSFPSFGIWLWMNNASYVQLHALDAEALAAGRFDDN